MGSWVDTRAKIKAKLDALVATPVTPTQPLGCVFNGEQPPGAVEIPAWPAAEIVRIQTNPDYSDNRTDIQDYVFAINLYYQLKDNNYAAVEILMDPVIDLIMQAFLSDATLTGTANARIRPIQSAASLTSWMGKPCRRDTIFIAARELMTM